MPTMAIHNAGESEVPWNPALRIAETVVLHSR